MLDEELSSLARKNVGRFHSLNQRLQAQGAAGPSRYWGAAAGWLVRVALLCC